MSESAHHVLKSNGLCCLCCSKNVFNELQHWSVFLSQITRQETFPVCYNSIDGPLISSTGFFNSSSFWCSTMSPSVLSNSEPRMSSWHWTPCSWVFVDSTLSKDNTGQRFPLTGRLRPCWGSLPDGKQTKKSWLKTSTKIHSTVLCDMPSRSIVSYYGWEKQGPALWEECVL